MGQKESESFITKNTFKILIYAIIALIAFITGYYIWAYVLSSDQEVEDCVPREKIVGVLFDESEEYINVTLAESDEEKRIGLMYVEQLGDDEGMLFIYDQPRNGGFWMKNTLIPLDIIFISEENKVVDILEDIQPCIEGEYCPTYYPKTEYLNALEVNGGYSAEKGIDIGDVVSYEYTVSHCK